MLPLLPATHVGQHQTDGASLVHRPAGGLRGAKVQVRVAHIDAGVSDCDEVQFPGTVQNPQIAGVIQGDALVDGVELDPRRPSPAARASSFRQSG